ncbi:efflux RND transporter periplasmic adaptor subunit [Paraflavitalea speifideaquila]|uniref:efflux RND transporter periplasmic adaptor subunit n=1 Tax=Paraflavitalea speifideaquila TaxID=3076558 RepID=UPI0028EF48FB|nr:efflux RND transporter periplasmic adaptor subunit [Paraflavitalea speifideiaquila]
MTVQSDTVKNEIAFSGKIEANEDKWVKVYPVVGGIVESLNVQLGDYVTRGQVLAVIRSSEIADYQGQLSNALSNVKLAEKTLSSNKDMFGAGLATEKEVVVAETELEKARADLQRIQETNAIYGARGHALQTITAPISGFIIEKNLTDKMQYRVDGAQPFFIISNLDEVWVMANVFESDIAKIKVGYDANVGVIAYKDKIFSGKVDRIFSMLDPQSRVMKVRIRIDNPGYLLKPEMFAQINIQYTEGNEQKLSVPAQTVIFDKNKNYVMVYKDACHIETRQVELYKTIGNTTYIQNGLAVGEQVISQYQLLVYNAVIE